MSKIKIITDSNSGILQKEGEQIGVFVIPMPFTIDGEEFLIARQSDILALVEE